MSEGVYFSLITAIYIACFIFWHVKLNNSFQKERDQWQAERKDLLDRIQAPTFGEYSNKVIREKKAEHPEEPKIDYDQFIS